MGTAVAIPPTVTETARPLSPTTADLDGDAMTDQIPGYPRDHLRSLETSSLMTEASPMAAMGTGLAPTRWIANARSREPDLWGRISTPIYLVTIAADRRVKTGPGTIVGDGMIETGTDWTMMTAAGAREHAVAVAARPESATGIELESENRWTGTGIGIGIPTAGRKRIPHRLVEGYNTYFYVVPRRKCVLYGVPGDIPSTAWSVWHASNERLGV